MLEFQVDFRTIQVPFTPKVSKGFVKVRIHKEEVEITLGLQY